MYRLFQEKCREPVSPSIYRKVFCENYNLGFYRPKKDKYEKCEGYENRMKVISTESNISEKTILWKEQIIADHEARLKRMEKMRILKDEAKEHSSVDPKFHFATFDLQSILQAPCADSSPMYYRRKIVVYNFTIYGNNGRGICYCWTEMDGKWGSSEIGTILIRYLKSLNSDIEMLHFFLIRVGDFLL